MDSLATLHVYKELADWYERQGQAAMRDRFLILAAESAYSAGKTEEAERLRQRLLQSNPHHMLKPFSSFAQALQSANVQIYVHDLQVNYPPETAESLLQNLRGGTVISEAPFTSPLIEMHDEPTLALNDAAEPLKVYPLQDVPLPAVQPTQLNRPAARKPTTVPLPEKIPLTPPTPRRPTVPPRPTRSAPLPVEDGSPAGAWLPLLLFGMTITAGTALAIYVLARPFLPREWLP